MRWGKAVNVYVYLGFGRVGLGETYMSKMLEYFRGAWIRPALGTIFDRYLKAVGC